MGSMTGLQTSRMAVALSLAICVTTVGSCDAPHGTPRSAKEIAAELATMTSLDVAEAIRAAKNARSNDCETVLLSGLPILVKRRAAAELAMLVEKCEWDGAHALWMREAAYECGDAIMPYLQRCRGGYAQSLIDDQIHGLERHESTYR